MTKKHWLIIFGLGTLFTLVIGGLQWYKFVTFGYNGLDLGIYHQVVWSLAHGHGFASSIHDPSYLGDHLEVWLIPLSWMYRLWESPLLLLWLQTIIIASSIIPLAKITRHILSSKAAIVAAVLFVVHPLVYNVSLYEFHGLAFALPIALWTIWFYQKKQYIHWVISLLALVIVREDMPLLVAGWAIMAAVDRRSWRWWLAPLAIAAAWFPAAQSIIRAANHDGVYKYLAFYSWLGTGIPEMLSFPFRHPIEFLRHVITFNNLGTITGLTVTFGFLPLLWPRRLWPLLILFAQLLLSNAQPGSFLKIHYPLPYLPFLFWAAIEAYREIQKGKIYQRQLGQPVSLLMAGLIVVLGPLYSSLIVGPLLWPWKNSSAYTPTSSTQLQLALQDVTPTDRVLTTFAYLPNFSNRESLYSLNYLYLGRRQYSEIPYRIPTDVDVAVIDWQQLYEYQFLYKTTVFENQSGLQRIQSFLDQQGLGIVKQYGSVAVYRQGPEPESSSTRQITPDESLATNNFGAISLIGLPNLRPSTGGHGLLVHSIWTANDTKQDDLISIRYIIKQNNRVVWQQPQILGQGTRAVSEWPQGTTWETGDEIVVPQTIQGAVSVSAQVFVPQGRYRLNRLQTFRPIIDSEKILGEVQLGQVTI